MEVPKLREKQWIADICRHAGIEAEIESRVSLEED